MVSFRVAAATALIPNLAIMAQQTGVLVGNSVPSEPDANRMMLLADDSAAQIALWGARWAVPIQRTA